MEMFRDLIGEIGVFMICAQAVVHFRPKEAYGKYLRLLLGVMMMVQIFAPVYGSIFGHAGENLTENIMDFQKELEEKLGEAAQKSVVTDRQLEETGLEMLREIWEQNGLGEESDQEEKRVADERNIEKTVGQKENSGNAVMEVKIRIDPVKVTE